MTALLSLSAAATPFSLALWLASAAIAAFLPNTLLAQNAAPIPVEEQRQVLTEPGTPALGSASAEITVVEYFDYNCPFCRKLAPAFDALTAADHTVAVIYKEWPIFGGASVYAARSALAANYQGKYLQAHDALISAPRLAGHGSGVKRNSSITAAEEAGLAIRNK